MKEIKGTYASAKVFADDVEEYALSQIRQLCDQAAFENSTIRVMPDVHPGKVGTVGFTATFQEKIMPAVVGLDIGCGMTIVRLQKAKLEYQKLDTVIRDRIPAGSKVRSAPHRFIEQLDLSELHCYEHIDKDRASCALGTLGGGNHFIEFDRDEAGALYAVIHSGSRILGKMVYEWYMAEGHKVLAHMVPSVPFELTWLEGHLLEDYIHDIQIVQEYARINRMAILDELMKGMKLKSDDEPYSCIHNYIAAYGTGYILRKGAISARKGERLVIPANMRDGIILGIGKGNTDWNESAPHGAGRVMKRTDIEKKYTVSEFRRVMKGIYSPSISADTLDEAPFAYRTLDEIRDAIKDTAEIERILRPVYNFKAGKE